MKLLGHTQNSFCYYNAVERNRPLGTGMVYPQPDMGQSELTWPYGSPE